MIKYKKTSNRSDIVSLEKEHIPEFILTWLPDFKTFVQDEQLVKKIYDIDATYHISDSLKRYAIYKLSSRIDLKRFHISSSRVDNITRSKVSIPKALLDDYKRLMRKKDITWFKIWDLSTDKWEFELAFSITKRNVKKRIDFEHMEYRELYLVFIYLIKKTKLFLAIDSITQDTYIVDNYNLHNVINDTAFTVIQIQECLIRGQRQTDKYRRDKRFLNGRRKKIWRENNEPNIKKLMLPFWEEVIALQKNYPYEWKEKLFEQVNFRLSQASTSTLQVEAKSNYRLIKPGIKSENLRDESIKEQAYKYWGIEIKNHILNGVEQRHAVYQPTLKIWKTEKE